MKPVLLFWLINLLALPGFAQDIASKVYAWNQAPVIKQAGFEDRTILEGSTRDFASLSLHAITVLCPSAFATHAGTGRGGPGYR